MEHTEEANLRLEMLWKHGLSSDVQQHWDRSAIIDEPLVLQGKRGQPDEVKLTLFWYVASIAWPRSDW